MTWQRHPVEWLASAIVMTTLGGCAAGGLTEGISNEPDLGKGDCFGEECSQSCGMNGVLTVDLEQFERYESGPAGLLDSGWHVTLDGFSGSSHQSVGAATYCDIDDAISNRGLDTTHPTIDFSGAVPFGWELWMVPPDEWCGEEANVACVEGSVTLAEAECGMSESADSCDETGALFAEAHRTEVVMSRVFELSGDLTHIGTNGSMHLSALFRFEPTTENLPPQDDGWVAIGLRPLTDYDGTTLWDPRHPRDPRIHWVNVTPATLQELIRRGEARAVFSDPTGTSTPGCDASCGELWFRVDLGGLFAPSIHRRFAVYLKYGTTPNAETGIAFRLDSLDLSLMDVNLGALTRPVDEAPPSDGDDQTHDDVALDDCDPRYDDDDADVARLDGFAGSLAPSEAREGRICVGDEDWYLVVPTADATTITLAFADIEGDLDLDTFTWDGAPLASSRSVTDNEEVTVETIEPFLARVYGYNDAEAQYMLTIE